MMFYPAASLELREVARERGRSRGGLSAQRGRRGGGGRSLSSRLFFMCCDPATCHILFTPSYPHEVLIVHVIFILTSPFFYAQKYLLEWLVFMCHKSISGVFFCFFFVLT